jgi:hypothetical protein
MSPLPSLVTVCILPFPQQLNDFHKKLCDVKAMFSASLILTQVLNEPLCFLFFPRWQGTICIFF